MNVIVLVWYLRIFIFFCKCNQEVILLIGLTKNMSFSKIIIVIHKYLFWIFTADHQKFREGSAGATKHSLLLRATRAVHLQAYNCSSPKRKKERKREKKRKIQPWQVTGVIPHELGVSTPLGGNHRSITCRPAVMPLLHRITSYEHRNSQTVAWHHDHARSAAPATPPLQARGCPSWLIG